MHNCSTNADCDALIEDDKACTVETCSQSNGQCVRVITQCSKPGQTCSSSNPGDEGCACNLNQQCPNGTDAECQDGLDCNGAEVCNTATKCCEKGKPFTLDV